MADALVARIFSGGWAFFLPYTGLHLVGLALDVRADTLRVAFWICHFTLLALAVPYTLRRLRGRYASLGAMLTAAEFWFWALLTLGFLLPGAYLEYPSDPWDHFARINSWRPDSPIGAAPFPWRWAYFFGWTFLSFVEPIHQRAALALLSAFWQVLLALQTTRLARRLGFSPAWSKVVVVGVIALFGNNLFSFFRYYALSSTPLAYIAFLRAAIAVLDLSESRDRMRSWWVLVATIGIMAFNHGQEVLLLAAFTGAVIFVRCFRHETGRGFGTLAAAAGLLGVSLALGWFVLSRPLALGLRPPATFYPFMSRFGSFRLWDSALSYFHTLGLHGCVSLGIALLMWRKERLLAALTLAPVFLLLFPPFAYPFAHVAPSRNTYRVLYAFPDSFMLAAAARVFPSRWLPAWTTMEVDCGRRLVCVAAFVLLGSVPWAPFFGKLPFQYHVPSRDLNLAPLDATAQWFKDNRRLADDCSVTSDDITESALTSFRGTGGPVLRTMGMRWLNGGRPGEWRVSGTEDLLEYRLEHSVCGFLALDDELLARGPYAPDPSWVGALSGHWQPNHANLVARQVAGLEGAANGLVILGWRRTFVPPFYWYYEPSDALP